MKTCADCKVAKPLDEFYSAKGYKGGVHTCCKPCHKARNDRSRQRHDTPERRRGRRVAYMTSHPDEVERQRERQRKWRRNNPAKNQETKRRHRARKYGSGGRHTEAEWRELCASVGHVCVRCKEPKPLTRDHIVPLTKGGSDLITNIQPLCLECNSHKGNRQSVNYLAVGGESEVVLI